MTTTPAQSELVTLIPFAGEFLALSPEQIEQALQRGRELMPRAAPSPAADGRDQVLDAEGMEKATGIPATWFLEQARRGALPHLRAGKYVRFRLNEVLEALRADESTRTRGPMLNGKRPTAQVVARRRYHSATTSRAPGVAVVR
jgi:hypothetical protein